jgi:putative flippase GtrA
MAKTFREQAGIIRHGGGKSKSPALQFSPFRDMTEGMKRPALSPLHRQLFRFLVTGGVNVLFSYAAYALLAGALGMDYAPALVLSWCAGVVFSYCNFRAFVFDGGRDGRSFLRFLPVYVVLLLIDLAALRLLVGHWGWDKLLAQALVVPFVAVLSFAFNRLFVFRSKPGA